jgi:hypothetical protein
MAGPDKKKTRVRKNVGKAIAHVKASFNNTIVTVTDASGQVIAWDSAGTIASLPCAPWRRPASKSRASRTSRRCRTTAAVPVSVGACDRAVVQLTQLSSQQNTFRRT